MSKQKLLMLLAVVMAVILAVGMANAAELFLGETVEVWHDDTKVIVDVSVYPGAASYSGKGGTVTGTFGDGTVLDYRFFMTENDAMKSYADGGAGIIAPVVSPSGDTVAGNQDWADVWTVTAPGIDYANAADFTNPTVAQAQNITGTIDVSELRFGKIYVIHGTYINSYTLTLTMSGAGLEDIVATYSQPNGPGKNMLWITDFDFVAGDGYETITYTYTNTDTDASRARFMGVVIDGVTTKEPEIIYPKSGEVVPPGEVIFDWVNLEPNSLSGATETYVDVWFGTEPNKVSGPTTGNYTKIVNGESINTITIPALAPGIYYWQIDSYTYGKPTTAGGTVDYSSGDPCMIEGGVYMFTNDSPVTIDDMGENMITWSGESVILTPNIIDDAGSSLTYLWTVDPADGVVITDADTATPTVTVTKDFSKIAIVNAGFEVDILDEDGWGGAPGWTQIGRMGNWNPPATAYTDSLVPEGVMCAWAQTDDSGLSQVLAETLTADAQYELTVQVGNSNTYDWTGYKVQLLAGGAVIAEDDSTLTPAPGTFEMSTVNYSYTPEDANKVGLPLEIRLLAGSLVVAPAYAECNFDDVQLSVTPDRALSDDVSIVTVTLEVNDETNPAVTDTVIIDVYDTACMAARVGVGLDREADYDESCLVDVADLATMAAEWLDDTSATQAFIDSVQPTGEIVINGDFQTIYEPGNPANAATIADGDYFNIPNQTLYAGAIATYADGTTGSGIELPGWIVAEGSKTNADVMQAGAWGGPDGSGDMALLCFAGWGGPTYVETAAPLSLPTRGPGVEYELSCDIYTNGGPVILELLVDGVVLTPDTESSPALIAGDWVKFTRTYSSVPDGDATIKVGTRDDAGTGWTGNRASIDNVELTFEITDPAAPSVDAGVDMVTWLGEPVQLAPIIEPNELLDPQPVLVYNWTAETVDGLDVVISDTTVEAPTVTITRVPFWREITIPEASFENRIVPDTNFVWCRSHEVPDWRFPDADGTAGIDEMGYSFIWNPGPGTGGRTGNWTADGFGGIVADGENCAFIGSRLYNDPVHPGGLTQLLTTTYNPKGSYELTAKVGRTEWRMWGGYKLELLAGGTNEESSTYTDKVIGGTVIGQEISTETPEAEVWNTATLTIGPNPAYAELAGEPLQVRITPLTIPDDPNTTYVVVDDFKLITDAPSAIESVELTLSVNNEGSSTVVTDFMKIDVYETACDVTKAVDPSAIDDTDHNIDCTTNLIDFAVLAADWLGDYSLTGPVAK